MTFQYLPNAGMDEALGKVQRPTGSREPLCHGLHLLSSV